MKSVNIETVRLCLDNPCEDSLTQVLDALHFASDASEREVLREYILSHLREWDLAPYFDHRASSSQNALADVQFEQGQWTPETLLSFALQERYRYLGTFQFESFGVDLPSDCWNFYINNSDDISYSRMEGSHFDEGLCTVEGCDTLHLNSFEQQKLTTLDFSIYQQCYLPVILIDKLDEFLQRPLPRDATRKEIYANEVYLGHIDTSSSSKDTEIAYVRAKRIHPLSALYRQIYEEFEIEYLSSLGF